MDENARVQFIKDLITGKSADCLDCQGVQLVPLHPRRKSMRGDINYKCPKCGRIYRPATMV